MSNLKSNVFNDTIKEFDVDSITFQHDVRKYYESKGVKNVTIRLLESVPRIMHKFDHKERKKYITSDATVIGPINIYFLLAPYDNQLVDMYNAIMLCIGFDIESINFVILNTDGYDHIFGKREDPLEVCDFSLKYYIFTRYIKGCSDFKYKMKLCSKLFNLDRSSFISPEFPYMVEKSKVISFSWKGIPQYDATRKELEASNKIWEEYHRNVYKTRESNIDDTCEPCDE